jgi:hypothetical protein
MGLANRHGCIAMQPLYRSEMMEENLPDDRTSGDVHRLVQYSDTIWR